MPATTDTHNIGVRGRLAYAGDVAREVALCAALWFLYRAVRGWSRSDLGDAFHNTSLVRRAEQALSLPSEASIQAAVLDHTWLVQALNWFYVAAHFPAAIGLLVGLFIFRRDRYRHYRNVLALTTGMAMVTHSMFPLAPPRMLAGFTDTMRAFGPDIYPTNVLSGAANQLAAMPSLHFGWALIVTVAIIRTNTGRWRWLAVGHPTAMLTTIVVTANHWWVDAAVAGALVGAAFAAVTALERRTARRAATPERPAVRV